MIANPIRTNHFADAVGDTVSTWSGMGMATHSPMMNRAAAEIPTRAMATQRAESLSPTKPLVPTTRLRA